MTAVKPYLQLGPATYEVNVAVAGGQLVMPDSTTGKIKPATAAATTVLGVASDDAAPAGSGSATDYGTLRPHVAVYSAPAEVNVLVSVADVAFGQKVIAGASGTVVGVGAAAALDGTTVVGYVTQPGGIVSGSRGRIKLV
jgi:hypothetical protein